MTNSDSDGFLDNDWEDRGELSWTEADWAKYLGEQEASVREYIRHYEQLPETIDRIDETARRMGWEMTEAAAAQAEEEDDDSFDDWDPYTFHRNPVYISTRALYVSLLSRWERSAGHAGSVPAPLGISLQGLLYRGSDQALQAIQALEMGDYVLAVCLFKRALRELNLTLARLNEPDVAACTAATRFRQYATPRIFDLREIWLRVMNECRQSVDGDDSKAD